MRGRESPERRTRLPGWYLRQGYFDGKGKLFPELITGGVENLARMLVSQADLTTHQLRRFYNMAKRLEWASSSGDFEEVKLGLQKLKAFAADFVARAEGERRREGREMFKEFIERNVDLATKDEKHFKAFIEHFQSLVAYFNYHKERRR